MEEKYIHFIANYDDWTAIKKLKITEQTDPRTVMEFLASLATSLDRKVEENLRKTVDLKKIDEVLNEMEFGKKENEIALVLARVNGTQINKAIKEITSLSSLQKNEQKELQDFCKVYALKEALKRCGLNIDYSKIEIPGLKRVKKSKA